MIINSIIKGAETSVSIDIPRVRVDFLEELLEFETASIEITHEIVALAFGLDPTDYSDWEIVALASGLDPTDYSDWEDMITDASAEIAITESYSYKIIPLSSDGITAVAENSQAIVQKIIENISNTIVSQGHLDLLWTENPAYTDHFYFSFYGESSAKIYSIKQQIDLSEYSTLKVDWVSNGGSYWRSRLRIDSDNVAFKSNNHRSVQTIDVSGYTGLHTFSIRQEVDFYGARTVEARIYNIELE